MLRAEVLALALPVLIGAALIALAVLVARTGWAQRHNRLFAALYFLSGVKSFADGLRAPVGDRYWADVFGEAAPLFPDAATWADVQVVTALFMAPLLLLFVLHFPQPSRVLRARPWLEWAAFAPTVLSLWIYVQQPPWLFTYFVGLQVVISLLTAAAVWRLLQVRRRAVDARERTQTTYVLAGFVPAFAVTWAIAADDLVGFARQAYLFPGFHQTLVSYVSPLLELGAAALVAYAILKYRILDIELQVKGGVKYVLMTLMVGTVLFGLVTYVENFVLQGQVFAFAGDAGSAVLSGVTTMLLFKPVERMSGKLSDRLFPETTEDPQAYARQRAIEIYRAQCTYALRDANVTDRELAFLVELRTQLQLTVAQAQSIEEEVERTLGVDDARTGRAGRLQNLVVAAREAAKAQAVAVRADAPEAAEVAAPAVTAPSDEDGAASKAGEGAAPPSAEPAKAVEPSA